VNVRTPTFLAVCAAIAIVQAAAAGPEVPGPRSTNLAPAQSAAAPTPSPLPAESVDSGGHTLDRADLEAWLDGMVPYALKAGDLAGAVVVVVKDGTVLLQKGYGYADVSKQLRMDPEQTMVRIGSTSKLFTWTAVMQLVEQGKLDLSRDVNDYLDLKIPHDFGKPITLRDLMNHRGGFEEGLKDVLRTDTRDLPSNEAYLKEHQRPMLFPPGEVPAYSNYGAALAGYIVQRVSGEPYERYVEHHILAPLGMLHTTFEQPLPQQFAGRVSNGYHTTDSPPGEYEQVVTRPAGSGTATAADMSRFMIALMNGGRLADGQILQAETLRQMQTPSESALTGFATMAHGIFRELHNGRVVFGHGGDTVLFHTEFNYLPEEHVGIYYTFNSRGRDNAVYLAREELFDGFMNRYFPDRAPVAADFATLPTAVADAQAIAGRYESSRRIAHGFLSIFYVLQQTVVGANGDGTISMPRQTAPGLATYGEVGPQLWREKGGRGQLSVQTVNGIKTIVDSSDPISVLQQAPFSRSAPLNLAILVGALIVVVLTVLGWILSPLLKQLTAVPDDSIAAVRRLRLHLRVAAAYDLLYMIAWFIIIRPVLTVDLGFYSSRLDPVVRVMQLAGILAFAAAGLGLWSAWRLAQLKVPRSLRIRGFVVAAGLLGVVWIAVIGGLTRFSLNY
jgi:CubicO group peptidase (beta-lactamase class C family)